MRIAPPTEDEIDDDALAAYGDGAGDMLGNTLGDVLSDTLGDTLGEMPSTEKSRNALERLLRP